MVVRPVRPASGRPRATGSRGRRSRWAFVFVFLSVWAAHTLRGQTPEYRLKAAVLTKFPQFVDWPQTALTDRQTLNICVTPSHPFGSFLRELVQGERFRNHDVVARELTSAAGIAGCHILFVARQDLPAGFLQRVSGRPVLTVGDDDRFLAEGGIINLLVVDGAIRFEVNETRARRVGLGLNAQLLRLAAKVHRSSQ